MTQEPLCGGDHGVWCGWFAFGHAQGYYGQSVSHPNSLTKITLDSRMGLNIANSGKYWIKSKTEKEVVWK